MGQKVNPIGLRLGINKTWKSKWYVDPRDYVDTLHEDLVLRKSLLACPEVQNADIADVEIIRKPQRITMVIATARPGIIIGAKGANVEKLAEKMQKLTEKKLNVARQIENRGAFRRIMKNSISRAMAGGAQGIKIKLSGRLGGADIARSEWMKEGRVPLHTLRSDIDYGFTTARTSYGAIGVKVWVFNGEIYAHGTAEEEGAGGVVRKKPAQADATRS